MAPERDLEQRVATAAAKLRRCLAEAKHWHSHWLAAEQTENQRLLAAAAAEHAETLRQAAADYEAAVAATTRELAAVTQSLGRLGAPWHEPTWATWTPATDVATPLPLRVGDLSEVGLDGRVTTPALVPFFGGGRSLVFKSSPALRDRAIGCLQSALLRLLAIVPPGKVRFTFLDSVTLGQAVAQLMPLADYDDLLVTGRVWTDPGQIAERLRDLTEYVETVIQQHLRGQFATIEEYNAQADEVAEPYRVLVAVGVPAGFDDVALRRLAALLANGPRCGVYSVLLTDLDWPPRELELPELTSVASVVTYARFGNRFVFDDDDLRTCLLELDAPPPRELVDRILLHIGAAAKAGGRVEVPFERTAEPVERWWTGDSSDGIRVALGKAGARRLQYLDLGKGTAQHALVAGKTGSGKSTLIHTLVLNLATLYGPEEVQVYLVDFKKGVEFKTYATNELPHARVVSIESEREFGLSVLQGLDVELERRGELFRRAGVDHVADYRRTTGAKLPRLLLVVDEFHEFFAEDDPISAQAAHSLDRLVRQGRAFGVHVFLASQTLAGANNLARSTVDQMAVRIALQCSEADSRLILAEDNPAARLLSRPGEGIYNAANGLMEGNSHFQAAWLSDAKRDEYLREIRTLADERGYVPAQPPIVFEGNAPARVERNQPLASLLSRLAPIEPGRALDVWLGDPVAIREPVAATFRRQSGSNLLVVGSNETAALGLLSVALVSLAAQLPTIAADSTSDLSNLYVLDFSLADGPHAGWLSRLVNRLGLRVAVGRSRQAPDVLAAVAAEVERRVASQDVVATGAAQRSPVFLVISGLHRARDLRQEDVPSFAFDSEAAGMGPAQHFGAILRDGPEAGVHTIVWCDTWTNLSRTLERRALREFAQRVAFQMSAEDSANLLDSPAAGKLGPYRALYYSEDDGRLEKLRPYEVPDDAWLTQAGEHLRAKSPARQP